MFSFYHLFDMTIEETFNHELLNKDVELNMPIVGIFISNPSCLVYSGEGAYHCLASYIIYLLIMQYNIEGVDKRRTILICLFYYQKGSGCMSSLF